MAVLHAEICIVAARRTSEVIRSGQPTGGNWVRTESNPGCGPSFLIFLLVMVTALRPWYTCTESVGNACEKLGWVMKGIALWNQLFLMGIALSC